jgi:hypothetical protein
VYRPSVVNYRPEQPRRLAVVDTKPWSTQGIAHEDARRRQ